MTSPLDVYEDYLLAKELQGVSQTTIDRYHYSIKRLLTELDINDISDIAASDIRRWLGAKTYGDVSRGRDIKNLKTYFRWVREEGFREDDPMPRIPMPKTGDPMKRALNEVEMSELIETARKSSRRDLAIVLTLTDTGVNSTAGEV